jgi:hypothetical protein
MDKEKLKKAIQEISNSMTRMDAERDLIKEIIKDANEEHEIDKKVLRKMARAYHKQNFSEEVATQEEFETLYQEVF